MSGRSDSITWYARAPQRWEPWQRAYQYGVLLLLPPEPLRSQVNALRATYDSYSQAICDAHISLTRPLPGRPGAAQWAELEAAAASIAPFEVQYGPLRHYLPHPGVCYTIGPQPAFDRLVETLEATSAFAGAPPRAYPFSAHMTIAEFISADETQALIEALQPATPHGTFLCSAVSYMVPDQQFHLEERAQLALGRLRS